MTWQLQRCRVAPRFSGEGQPAGLLTHTLKLQELEDDVDHIGLSQFMLWANNEQTRAPPDFRWLTQYIEKLADRHSLPVTPVGLRSSGVQPFLTLGDASIIAHGHRSLVLRLTSDADYVVKIGKTSHISNEVHIQTLVDKSNCQHLRKAIVGFCGHVEGAGPDLSYIGLEHYCEGSIQPHHMPSDEDRTKFLNQVRAELHAAISCTHSYRHLRTLQCKSCYQQYMGAAMVGHIPQKLYFDALFAGCPGIGCASQSWGHASRHQARQHAIKA